MSDKKGKLFGESGGQHPFARFVDHSETYGPRIVSRFVAGISRVDTVVDLGAGSGRDLDIVARLHPASRRIAVEGGHEYAVALRNKAHEVHVIDIERDALPFSDESVDLFIANQVLEHTKEIFWIFHEVTRCLQLGGKFLFGVPNIASFHNRVLLLFGGHPTQHKLCSAHVRPFSKKDTLRYLEACFENGYALRGFGGAQFYPFPPAIARQLCNLFPSASFSIFFLIEKLRPYKDEFACYPAAANLETNFWTGGIETHSQYSKQTLCS